MHPSHQSYPAALLQDRYGGGYSGSAWLALACADDDIDGMPRILWAMSEGPGGDDLEAAGFWQEPPPWIAVGATPDQALAHLIGKATSD